MIRCSLALLAVIGLPSIAPAHEPAAYAVGVAAVDITPDYPVRLNGFGGRHTESIGVRQHIYAKALAISTRDDDAVVVITVDTLGIPDSMTERLAAKLKVKAGIDRSRLAISASHTHSGPMIRDCANTLYGQPIPDEHWQRILKYTDELEAGLERVALEALAARKPATLSWAIGKVGFAQNRRTNGGPVDHDLPVLAVHEPDGKLKAVFTNYACHCVTLSDFQISGDWAGYAMDHIQRRNPGCEALISIGCGADANPRGGVLGGRFEVADGLGQEIAEEVQRLLTAGLTPLTQPPVAMLERTTLKLAPLPTRERWEQLAKEQNATGHHARTQIGRLDRGEPLMTEISYPVQTITFGDELAWVFLPGEVVVDYALRLKQELNGAKLWINAYSNACPGYVPSERILREGGYEGGGAMIYYDIPGPYATGLEQTIVDAVRSQVQEKFQAVVDVTQTNGIRPQTPEESLLSLRTKPGFRAELVASEPLIESPVAIAFGPDGKLWVAEMSDYPGGGFGSQDSAIGESNDALVPAESRILNPESTPSGQIRCVHDDNGDGVYDRSDVFLTGIPFPTGVTVWRNGVLICAAPDILFAEDTDGDGKADDVRKLFTGFATHNYQARVNSLEYGLDGWVYGACGIFGGDITNAATGEVIALGQRDFRFRPDTSEFEPVTGSTQQGRVRNDEDDWFGCNSGSMLMHYPLADHYLRRNPFLVPPSTVVGIAAEPDPGRLYSISDQVLFMLSGPPNRPTAACGLGIYRDDFLGEGYRGNAFTCEPVNNLVHRQSLTPSGVTFSSRRAEDEQDREFLASTDPWFRPVQVRTGPDGALWVVDMYRYVIEHPIWIPPDTLATIDPRAGSTMGRIYRIVPESQPARTMPRLDRLTGTGLAAAMDSPNGTQRDLVQQLIQWRVDTSTIPTLSQLCRNSIRPAVRVQALSTWANLLDGERTAETGEANRASHSNGLNTAVSAMLADDAAEVRRHAVRIAERAIGESQDLAEIVVSAADDEDAFVRLQAGYSAVTLQTPYATRLLTKLLLHDADSAYIVAAAESSLTPDNVIAILTALRAADAPATVSDRIRADAVVLAPPESVKSLLLQSAQLAVRQPDVAGFRQFAGLLESLRQRPADNLATDAELQKHWTTALSAAIVAAADETAEPEVRLAAIHALAHGTFLGQPQTEILASLLILKTPPELQAAAIAALGRDGTPDIAERLMFDWPSREPRLRREIIGMLLTREAWTATLLAAIERGTLSAVELDLLQQQALRDHADVSIRTVAARSFARRITANRQEVIDRYAAAIHNRGDAFNGKQVFQKHCANCHRLQDVGHEVGPDLAAYGGKSVQSLLIALFDPNQAVDPRYQNYIAVLNDGRSVTGLITEETSSGFTLLAAEAKKQHVLRSEVDELRSTGKTLMPEGFEQNATTDNINDLWAWVGTLRAPPKFLDGNQPVLVEIPAAGNVALLASQAEIRGGDITFELPFQNVGYWHGADDFVRWRITSRGIREMDVWGEWACDPGAAGNSFRIDGAAPSLTGFVSSTGAWSRYQLHRLGTIVIRDGESEIIMRPAQAPKSAMVDLRALHLVAFDTVPLAAGGVASSGPSDFSAVEIADFLLNEEQPAADREALIAKCLAKAAAIIPQMAEGLPQESGSAEEYRRIPWIWRVAIAVGKGGDAQQIHDVLKASLPLVGKKLEHWQAVVIGGGLINGISLSNKWPLDELTTVIGEDPVLLGDWKRTLDLAVAMADDESVPTGTRYDALRIVAMLDWTVSRPILDRFLQKGVHDELQMGAVSGLSDIAIDDAGSLLINAFGSLSSDNRKLAFDALFRTETRRSMLLAALTAGTLPAELKDDERVKALK